MHSLKRKIKSLEKELNSSKRGVSERLRAFKSHSLSFLADEYLSQRLGTQEFCAHWSSVAEICSGHAYQYAYKQLCRELGTPVVRDEKGVEQEFRFTVIALGKLGAGELNLSSDIDLIFLYNSDNGYVKGSPTLTLHEFAVKLSSSITLLLSKIDEHGFCFRVDNDIRPEGKSGPLANSIDAAVNYYNDWGQEWERMMLIRANPIAGDINLGADFVGRVRSLIYRKNWDINSIKKIKETKEKIEQEASKSTKSGINVKLGSGGIREVEFIVQSLQILHGAKVESLITRNTFDAIDALKKAKILPPRQCDELKDAYTFLRYAENMIQLPGEKQTHILPTDPGELNSLAERMGYTSDRLMTDVDRHMGVIKKHFQHIFQTDPEQYQMEDAIFTNISSCASPEEEVDSLPWFKNEEVKKIRYQDIQENLPIDTVSIKLSLVAEVVLAEAYKLASTGLRKMYGAPICKSKNNPVAGISIVGMGKLGGREIDYASDLDIMFIYSEDGTTAGPKKISNKEYFTKLSQRIISLISLPTRYGRAYEIDADLRPSGRTGVLVTSLNSFKNYHLLDAGLWERQALIKARTIAGDVKFCATVDKLIAELCYAQPLPKDSKEKINELRIRMEKELGKETEKKLNVKLGAGGLMDIESLVQYLQLKYGASSEDVREHNTIKSIAALKNRQLIREEDAECLLDAYQFYKSLLSRIRLFSNHATNYLDMASDHLPQIAKSLGFNNESELVGKFRETKKRIRTIYSGFFC